MWSVKCEFKDCEASTDGFTAMEEKDKTWFENPTSHSKALGGGWLCKKHQPVVAPSPTGWVNPTSTWVGETLPDPEVLIEMTKNMTGSELAAFTSTARPPNMGMVHNMMRPKITKPWFTKLDMAEYPETERALDSVVDRDPKLAKELDQAFDIMFDQPNPLQKEFGFNDTEEGSQERYQRRQKIVPWSKHTVWWFVHNCIAHPLIGILPVRTAFRFHDWTSLRMHGVK